MTQRRTQGTKMLEGEPKPSGLASPGYSYPGELARFVRNRWDDAPGPTDGAGPTPDAAALKGFFAACYQARSDSFC